MRYNDFVKRVAEANPERSHQDAAHAAAQAVLEALQPHLSREEVAILAAKLPEDLAATFDAAGADPAARGEPDLGARVVERVGVAEDEAEGFVRAVGTALGEMLEADEYDRMMGSLPTVVRAQLT